MKPMREDFYEAPERPRWCSRCERWDEDCICDFDSGEDVCVHRGVPASSEFPSKEMLGEITDPDSLDYSRGVKIIKDKDGNLHFRPATERKMDNES